MSVSYSKSYYVSVASVPSVVALLTPSHETVKRFVFHLCTCSDPPEQRAQNAFLKHAVAISTFPGAQLLMATAAGQMTLYEGLQVRD